MSRSDFESLDSGVLKFKNPNSSKILHKMYKNSETADVFFIFSNESKKIVRISAHKSVLAQGSPVFHQMFFGPLREPGDVQIEDAVPEVFEEFLQIFYLDQVTLTSEHAADVLYLSNKYDLPNLTLMCGELFEETLNRDTMCWGYELALLYNLEKLRWFCEKEIAFDASHIFESESFLNCERETLKRILWMDNLNCTEVEIFDACMKWADKKISLRDSIEAPSKRIKLDGSTSSVERKNELGVCFNLIRFPAMSTQQFSECLKNQCSILNSEEIVDIENHINEGSSLVAAKHFNNEKRIWNSLPSYMERLHCERFTYENWNNYTDQKDLDAEGSFTFSASKRIILTALIGEIIKSRYKIELSLRAKIEIYTKSNGSLDNSSYDQLVGSCMDKVSTSSAAYFCLKKPIVINANQIYEIRIKFIDSPRYMYLGTYIKELLETVTLENGVEIKFNEDDYEYGNTHRLIPELVFVSFY